MTTPFPLLRSRQPKAGAQEARRGADVACAFAALPRFSVTAMLLGEGEKEGTVPAVAKLRPPLTRARWPHDAQSSQMWRPP